MKEKKYFKLTPFKMQVLQSFPFIDADFDALTNYELLCKVVEYLNKTVSNVDLLHEQVETFQQYFDNLDVQEEINNKLDDMAEDGTLQEIISEYLNSTAIFGYNTVNDMINASNLIDGSYAKTMGYTNIKDGRGELYKIRQIINTDVIDDYHLIAMTNNTLVAELIDNVDNIVVVGDSYTALSNSNWAELLASQLHLTLYKHATSSMGYVHAIQNKTFIDNLTWGMSYEIRQKTKYLICYGGLNDLNETPSDVTTAVQAFCTQAKEDFPNAQIIIVGPQSDIPNANSKKLFDIVNAIQEGAVSSGVSYADAHTWLYDTPYGYVSTYASDQTHPNELGYKIIASKMLSLIIGNINDKSSVLINPYTNLESNTSIRTTQNLNSTHLDIRITNITMDNEVFTKVGKVSTKNLGFVNTRNPLMVLGYNTTYNFYTKLIGFATIGGNGDINACNISGSQYSGAIEVVGDIQLTFNNQN